MYHYGVILKKIHHTHLSPVSGRLMSKWLARGDDEIFAPLIFDIVGVNWLRKGYKPD